MGTVWPLPLLLLLGFFPWWSLGVESLKCHNDFFNNVTCVWNSKGVAPETACTLKGISSASYSDCNLATPDVSRPNWRSCSLIFNEVSITLTLEDHIYCTVQTS
ncbi:interleukin-2 receptor subunit beta-like [Arapaima gigas]